MKPLTKAEWGALKAAEGLETGGLAMEPTPQSVRSMWATLDALFAYRERTRDIYCEVHQGEHGGTPGHVWATTDDIAKELGLE